MSRFNYDTGAWDAMQGGGSLAAALVALRMRQEEEASQNRRFDRDMDFRAASELEEARRFDAQMASQSLREQRQENQFNLGHAHDERRLAMQEAEAARELAMREAAASWAASEGLATPERMLGDAAGPTVPGEWGLGEAQARALDPRALVSEIVERKRASRREREIATLFAAADRLGSEWRNSPQLREISARYGVDPDEVVSVDDWQATPLYDMLRPEERAMTDSYVSGTGRFPPQSMMSSVVRDYASERRDEAEARRLTIQSLQQQVQASQRQWQEATDYAQRVKMDRSQHPTEKNFANMKAQLAKSAYDEAVMALRAAQEGQASGLSSGASTAVPSAPPPSGGSVPAASGVAPGGTGSADLSDEEFDSIANRVKARGGTEADFIKELEEARAARSGRGGSP